MRGEIAEKIKRCIRFPTVNVLGRQATPAPAPASGADPAEGVRLVADFGAGRYHGGDGPLPDDVIAMEGCARVVPGRGLAVFKGGVNEVVDPCFAGEGWRLSSPAAAEKAPGTGESCLLVTGDGSSGEVASLAEPIPLAGGAVRAVSFDYLVEPGARGSLVVTVKTLAADGSPLRRREAEVGPGNEGWRRGYVPVIDLPPPARAYTIEIGSRGFKGTCRLRSFLAEPEDFYNPYFDGDGEGCSWVRVATPGHPFAVRRPLRKGQLVLRSLLLAAASALPLLAAAARWRRWRLLFLAAAPLAAGGAVARDLGSGGGRRSFIARSRLAPARTWFYRVTAVDEVGRETPPSFEVREQTTWLNRRIALYWERDPRAVAYRVYRSERSRGPAQVYMLADPQAALAPGELSQEEYGVFTLAGKTAHFIDAGEEAPAAVPPSPAGGSGRPHAARSLRPVPDVRIDNREIGLDTRHDFWVAGEVEVGFRGERPFHPASLFEVGDPGCDTSFAASLRFVPRWGDTRPHILLIRNSPGSKVPDKQVNPLPAPYPGMVIRYLAALSYRGRPGLDAGAHMWYRVDGGPVQHLYVANTDTLGAGAITLVSKRYFFDYFGNNSFCRIFAIIQGTPGEDTIGRVMDAKLLGEALEV